MGVYEELIAWRKKPKGNVKLKSKYKSIAKHGYIFTHKQTNSLLKNDIASEVGTSYSSKGVRFNGSAGDKIQLDAPLDFSETDECTIIFRYAKGLVITDNDGIFGDKNVANWSATDGLSISIRNDGGILFVVGSSSAYTTTNYFNDKLKHNVIVRYKKTEPLEIWIDEKEITYSSQGNGPASYVKSSVNARIGTYYDESAGRTGNGYLDFLYTLDKKIPIAEALKISRQSYSVVKPRIEYTPYSVAGGAEPLMAYYPLSTRLVRSHAR